MYANSLGRTHLPVEIGSWTAIFILPCPRASKFGTHSDPRVSHSGERFEPSCEQSELQLQRPPDTSPSDAHRQGTRARRARAQRRAIRRTSCICEPRWTTWARMNSPPRGYNTSRLRASLPTAPDTGSRVLQSYLVDSFCVQRLYFIIIEEGKRTTYSASSCAPH